MRLTERTLLLTTLGRAATTLTEVPITWHAAPSHVPFVQACATIVAREKVQLHLCMSKLPAAAAGAGATSVFSPSLAAQLLCARMSRLHIVRLALCRPLPSLRRAAATSLPLPLLALLLGSLSLQSLAPLLRDDFHLRTRVQRSKCGLPGGLLCGDSSGILIWPRAARLFLPASTTRVALPPPSTVLPFWAGSPQRRSELRRPRTACPRCRWAAGS